MIEITKPNCLFVLAPCYFDENGEYIKVIDMVIEARLHQFSVHCTSYDCDLRSEIERYQADLILFITPAERHVAKPCPIPTNHEAHPGIPRIGLLNCDKYSPVKFANYQLLRKLKCQACFCALSVPGELAYEESDCPIFHIHQGNTFTNEIFHDYGEEKSIAIGAFGAGFFNNTSNHYPWRKKIAATIMNRLPILYSPRPEPNFIIPNGHDLQLLDGNNNYPRMINRCYIALTCGTEQNNILCKHIEIPACRTCLMTEESAILKSFGFEDMKNCVFVDESNVIEKLEYLFSNRAILQAITDAGYELAQTQINPATKFATLWEWYKLYQTKCPEERILQDSMFSFRLTTAESDKTATIENGPDAIRLHYLKGYQALFQNQIDVAQREFQAALGYIAYNSEALIGQGIIMLLSQQPTEALRYFLFPQQHATNYGGLSHYYDPVEFSYAALTLLCLGQEKEAHNFIQLGAKSSHPAISAITAILKNDMSFLSDHRTIKSRTPTESLTAKHWYNHFLGLRVQYVPGRAAINRMQKRFRSSAANQVTH